MSLPDAEPLGPEGILLVDKPSGWTSHDCVAVIRKLFPKKTKVGHSGTLDPNATGLLIILIGKATKSADLYQGLDKVYTGVMKLGIETESGDLEAPIIREAPVNVSQDQIRSCFSQRTGEIEMVVPRFSSVKYKGKPMHKYARRGISTPQQIRVSRIDSLESTGFEGDEVSFRVACGSGTYVRALTQLIGKDLGCGATLSALRRERIGAHSIEDSLPLETVRDAGEEGVRDLLKDYEAVR